MVSMSVEPLTAQLEGGTSQLMDDRNEDRARRTQVAAKLKIRRKAAHLQLIRGILLLLINAAAVLLQCVSLDVTVRSNNETGALTYDFDEAIDFAYVVVGMTVASWVVLVNYYAHKWYNYLKFDLLPRSPNSAHVLLPSRRARCWGFDLIPGRISGSPFYRSHMLPYFMAEALVQAIQPIPWWRNVWAYEGLGLLMFVRLYVIARVVRDWAQVYAQKECLHGKHSHVPFTCRLAFKVCRPSPARTHATALSARTHKHLFGYSFASCGTTLGQVLYSQKPMVLLSCVFAVFYSMLIFCIHVYTVASRKRPLSPTTTLVDP